MNILTLVSLSIPVALGLLPYAIYEARKERQQARYRQYTDGVLMHAIDVAQGYRSSQLARLGEILIELQLARSSVRVLDTLTIDQTPAIAPPAEANIGVLVVPSLQSFRTLLSKYPQGLGTQLALAAPSDGSVAQLPQPDSPAENLIEDSSQEPEISHGGE